VADSPGAESSEAREERWFDAFQVSWQPVPLPLYDEWLKPAERAYGEMVELIDRYEKALHFYVNRDNWREKPGYFSIAQSDGGTLARKALDG
jgi:hypothetical protein